MYYAGIDGGGTKTVLAVADENQNIIFRTRGGGTNIWGGERAMVTQSLADLFSRARGKCGIAQYEKIVFGDSSLFLGERRTLSPETAALFPSGSVRVLSDLEILLEAADEENAAVIVSGTGSMLIARSGGRTFSVGGYGHLVGDEGSAYEIGGRGIRGAVAAFEGWGRHTALSDALLRYFSVGGVKEIVEKIYTTQQDKSLIAGFSKEVELAAAEGDAVAIQILDSAAASLFAQWRALLSKTEGTVESVYFSGGVLGDNKIAAAALAERISRETPGVAVKRLRKPPEIGALRLCFARPYKGDLL